MTTVAQVLKESYSVSPYDKYIEYPYEHTKSRDGLPIIYKIQRDWEIDRKLDDRSPGVIFKYSLYKKEATLRHLIQAAGKERCSPLHEWQNQRTTLESIKLVFNNKETLIDNLDDKINLLVIDILKKSGWEEPSPECPDPECPKIIFVLSTIPVEPHGPPSLLSKNTLTSIPKTSTVKSPLKASQLLGSALGGIAITMIIASIGIGFVMLATGISYGDCLKYMFRGTIGDNDWAIPLIFGLATNMVSILSSMAIRSKVF